MIRRKTLKQILIALISGILILTSCRQTQSATQTAPTPVVGSATITLSPIPTATQPSLPTATPTASITPLPTIPTFTPTFDSRTIVTVTPAPPAVCPKENPEIVADFSDPYIYGYDEVLTYLNSGGSLAQLAAAFSDRDPDSSWGRIRDLTGDGSSEIVYRGLGGYNILGCKNGKYQSLFEFARDDFRMDLEDILDLNKNGIPELIFYSFIRHGFAEVYIIGWNGNGFHSLINLGVDTTTGAVIDSVSTAADYKIMDTNADGLKEIVVVDNAQEALPDFSYYWRPLRNQTITLGWNDKNYVDLKQGNYTPPQYRFQAIQDGDWQVRYGDYVAALSLYQEAIFNEQLEWWSPERKDYENYVYISQYEGKPIVSPKLQFLILQNILAWPRTLTFASCSSISCKNMKQMQSQSITPCKRNLAMINMVVPMLKWQPCSGRHTSPHTEYTMVAQQRSNTRSNIPRF